MILRVGPYLYRVHFVEEPIEHEGEPCLGLCDNEQQALYVCTHASYAQQIQLICHEYMEAWLYHFGAAGLDKEGYCDLFGAAMTQFVTDLLGRLDEVEGWLGVSAPPAEPAPPPPGEPASVARRLADRAARAGLKVRSVYDPPEHIRAAKEAGRRKRYWRASDLE